ncbi:TIGR00725 family protein [Dethiobacter alkaliphilus]|uniref:TIGR00725 family protein n=1 Tax=Dethiobacter alkaliphilus TaxID=427926 RepID=UPI0022276769|nr:TIGR00725 family protein [Dethiobacter alkaliphilus]MCW3489954.1 TIGR00725 family protein [Dethiobacter alkaliphilus]
MVQQKYVGVIGAAECGVDVVALAEEVGKVVAKSGSVLVCGGRSGVMEAAAKGARDAGGIAIGILPGDDPRSGNSYINFGIATGMGDARNVIIARTCDVLVAVTGSYGTLSEIGLAMKMGKPVIGLKTWRCIDYCGQPAALHAAEDVADVEEILNKLLNNNE